MNQENNKWYIFEEDHHSGPYSTEEIKKWIFSGRLNGDHLIWTEGSKGWVPISKVSLFEYVLTETKKHRSQEKANLENLSLLQEKKPKLSIIKDTDTTVQEKEIVKQETVVKTFKQAPVATAIKQDPIVKKDSPRSSTAYLKMAFYSTTIFSLLTLLATGIFLYIYLFKEKDLTIKLKSVTDADVQRLIIVANDNPLIGFKIFFAISKNGNGIIATTNRRGPGIGSITLKSLPGRILSSQEVFATSKTVLNESIYNFKTLKLEKGDKLSAGYYSITFEGEDHSIASNILKYLKMVPRVKDIFFVKDYSHKLFYQGTILLSTKKESEFIKTLEAFHKSEKEKKLTPYKEVLETYKTYLVLIDKLESIATDIILNLSNKSQIKKLETKYTTEIIPVLQEIVLSLTKKLENQEVNPDAKVMHEELQEFGKGIGQSFADLLVDCEKQKKFSKKVNNDIVNKYKTKLAEMRQLGNQKIIIIEADMANL